MPGKPGTVTFQHTQRIQIPQRFEHLPGTAGHPVHARRERIPDQEIPVSSTELPTIY